MSLFLWAIAAWLAFNVFAVVVSIIGAWNGAWERAREQRQREREEAIRRRRATQ